MRPRKFWISDFDLEFRILTEFQILILNFEFSIKLNSIWIKCCTPGLLRSLITNSNSKLRNSIWQIQYGRPKCKKLLNFEEILYTRIRISLWNSLEKVILYILKIPTKFGVVPQSFCQNPNPVQDQDQDHDFTLDFNTRPTFHTQKTPTKFRLDSLIPSKVIVSTAKVHVQTDGNFFLLVLSSKTYETWTFVKRREFFFSLMRLQ